MNNIAVLLTCFNRKQITLRCLNHFFQLRNDIDVFLVDDNSSDGTYSAIKEHFPQVNIIKGKGDLFWCRGMNIAWKHASEKNKYDFFLWLNDDVILYKDAFEEILKCSEIKEHKAIVSGVIENHDKNKIIYGGFDENKNIIIPKGIMKSITFLNGNFVLIPRFVFEKIGFMDKVFHHDLGDVDYGLRAIKKGIQVMSTTKPIGSCGVNNICRVRLNNSTLLKRFKRLYSPLGSNPNINFYYRKQHKGILNAAVYYLFLIFLNIIPDKLNTVLFKQKYT
ncbi:glycosyltransferase family 2 protein [Wenyingzhuangia sp. chi5]|uniref:Glycosyltransferase family 2 protein n=1 Tax=Wenyingzhuangia gilva TaxID=3057677 RepID=A0ABT8VNS4_9FLAO|nr:glycosyltransferase family 2 protein [Wenyingzhuangia sp. chi5]MDO3693629.1 glycosyltransferase family 2 protein [Wenyingzhuangia sp. chi5]